MHTAAHALAAYAREERADARRQAVEEVAADVATVVASLAVEVDGALHVGPDDLDEVREDYVERVPDPADWRQVLDAALRLLRARGAFYVTIEGER